MTNANRTGLPVRPTKGAQLRKRGRARLPVPPPACWRRAAGNRSPTNAAKRLAPPTTSGGRAGFSQL